MATVVAKTKLDNRGFNTGVEGMKGKVKGFASTLGNIKGLIAGAFAIGGLVRLTRSAIAAGSILTDMALQTGLTTDEFQALEIAAINAGTPMEKIRGVMTKLSVVLGQAKSGMKTYVDLFNKAGISTQEFIDLDTAQALKLIADRMQTATEGSVQFGAILELLGTRSGIQLREVMTDLSQTTLPGLIKRFKETGDIIDKDMLQVMDKTEDAMQRFGRRLKFDVGEKVLSAALGIVVLGKAIKGFALGADSFSAAFSSAADDVFQFKTAALKSFEELAASAAAAEIAPGEIIDIADVKLLERWRDLLEEQRQAQLTLNEKITEREEILKDIDEDLEKNKNDTNAILELEIERLEVQKELNKLKEEEVKKAEKLAKLKGKENQIIDDARKKLEEIEAGEGISIAPAVADRIARIGGQIGGAASPQLRTAERNLQIDEDRNTLIEATNEKLEGVRKAQGLA